MGTEDDTLIMPRGEGEPEGPGEPPSGGPKPPSGTEKIVIITTIIALFVIAAVIVIAARSCGGDEPAPQVETLIETVVETATVAPATTSEEPADTGPPPRGDIEAVNWRSEVGAQPMVREVEDVVYGDLDGDGYDDALVLVRLEGSGAYLDYYVYTYRGESLVQLFAKTGVERGRVEPAALPRSFVETTPVYAPGDPNCCPSELQLTTYTWSASAGAFVETSVETVPNPAP